MAYGNYDIKTEHMIKLVESELDDKIKRADAIDKKVKEIQDLSDLIVAALVDSGHQQLATYIVNRIAILNK